MPGNKIRYMIIKLLTGKKIWAVCVCGLFFLTALNVSATAITVPPAARETAENVKTESQDILNQAKTVNRMENVLQNIKKEIERLEQDRAIKKPAMEKTKTEAAGLEAKAQQAEIALPEIKAEMDAANQTLEKTAANVETTEKYAAESSAREAAANQVLLQAIDNVMISNSELEILESKYNACGEEARAAFVRHNNAVIAHEDAENRLAAARKRMENIEKVRTRANEAGEIADAAALEFLGLEEELKMAKEDFKAVEQALADSQTTAEISDRLWRYFSTGAKFYNWQDDAGNSGYQFYQPIMFGYVKGNMEYFLSSGYVISNNKSVADGRVSTFTDTALNAAYTTQKGKYTVIYILNTNIPTGRSALRGTNAIMSDDLVEFSRFGGGWNFTPGVLASWKIGKEDTWTIGTYYSFNGSYTLDESTGSRLNPGNGWSNLLQWRHAGQKWQFVGELIHGKFGSSREDEISYRQGNQLDVHLTYNRVLADNQDLMFYYWCTNEQPYVSGYPGFEPGRSTTTNYLGTMWSRALNEKNVFRVMFDYMKRTGNIYDPVTTLTHSGRQKYTVGLGYDYKISRQEKLAFDVEAFRMRDDAPSSGKYHGYNFYVRYLKYM